MDGVNQRLERIEAAVALNQATDELEVAVMSEVSDRLVRGLEEVRELRTVTDGIVSWSQTVTTSLADVRAQLAARGVTDADLASLDEMIAVTDSQTGRLAQVLTTGTEAEDEEPENPVPPVVDPPVVPTPGGDATDPSSAPDV